MKSRTHLLQKALMHQDFVATASMARTARSSAIGTAMADAAKDLLAFAFRFIQPGPAGGRSEWNAIVGSNDALAAGRWIEPKVALVLTTSQSTTVFCNAGIVWITQGDSNDFVMNAGEELILHPVDKLVVTALAGPAFIRYSMQRPPVNANDAGD